MVAAALLEAVGAALLGALLEAVGAALLGALLGAPFPAPLPSPRAISSPRSRDRTSLSHGSSQTLARAARLDRHRLGVGASPSNCRGFRSGKNKSTLQYVVVLVVV